MSTTATIGRLVDAHPTRVATATVEPVRPFCTCTCVGIRLRSSVTWLTTPTVRPPARSPSRRVHHVVEGVGVQRAEALVDEERVDLGAAGLLGDHVGEAEGQGQ